MEETNDYAYYQRVELGKPCGYTWTGVDVADIGTYIGLVMWMGIIVLPELRMYWAKNATFSVSSFPQAMSRRRFEAITKYFHTFNRRAIRKGNEDRLVIIRPILNHIMDQCRAVYVPAKKLSIDEGMLKWKGRLSIRVYNPMKPTKYGIKFYFLCEAKTGYVLDCIIYRGVSSTLRDIVFTLMGQHLGKGYHLFMDNFYNSVSLAEELYANNTHVSGTLRLARGAPKSLQNIAKNKSLSRGEMAFRKKDNTYVICWQDIRLVSFVSTSCNASTEEFVHKRKVKRGGRYVYEEVTLQRPNLVREYVNYMGGVDQFDQMINYYAIARRTYRWTKKTVFYLLQLGLINAHNLYKAYGPPGKKLRLRNFQQVIADHLLYFDESEWPDSGVRIPHAASLPVSERHDKIPERDPAQPPPTPGPSYGRSGPSSGTPGPITSTPVGSSVARATSTATPGPLLSPMPGSSTATPSAQLQAEEEAVDDPGLLQDEPAAPAARPRGRHVVDHPDRLDANKDHFVERVGRVKQQLRCRVCAMQGKRRDTCFQCGYCKIGLCTTVKRDCFRLYHTKRQYWKTSAGGAAAAGSGARRWQ